MRYRRLIRGIVNPILIATMCMCLAIVRPKLLYAGPCADAAAATHDAAIASCLAALMDAEAVHDDAQDVFDQAQQLNETITTADIRACDAAYDAGAKPCRDFLDQAVAILVLDFALNAAQCLVFAEPDAVAGCLAINLAWLAGELIVAYGMYLICIEPVYSAWSDCKALAIDASTARGLAALAAKAPADAAWLDAQATHSDCDDAADVAYEAELAACPDPDV